MIGKLDGRLLDSFLETIPIEFSIVDSDDKVAAWNKHETRTFKRPMAALGLDVHNCHPSKSVEKVERILAEMKDGSKDKARFWIDIVDKGSGEKEKIMIEYYALRDGEGNYLGCLEASQRIGDIMQLKGEKRLLDL
ncbi:MAG: PAS domain-containing protein [Candidatus Methanofastidiosa archaeon]|nr:PAS domain-containing protein [Candidatus Methanofastidiosa archaeon]